MRYIYVENFRGFKKEFIPLSDVNFLLGENSTGKSSILALLNLFSSPQFWFRQDFNTDEYQLGNFKDIVSVNAPKSKYFRVGLIEKDENIIKNKQTEIFLFLMEFREKNGVPRIARYWYVTKNNSVEIILSEKRIQYHIGTIPLLIDDDSIRKVFNSWLSESKNKFKTLKIPSKMLSDKPLPLPLITSYIDNKGTRNKKKDLGMSFLLRTPDFSGDLSWIAPIRSKPKRTYDQFKSTLSPEGDHVPYLISKFLAGNRNNPQSKNFRQFISAFGKESGLMADIDIKSFGKAPAAPFELDILLEKGKPLNISSVGYGVSQALPILVDAFTGPQGAWFAIQQPEVHLHPRAQAALGDIFFHLAKKGKKHFFIETHSDFIIDRYRMNMLKTKDSPSSQILFFERKKGFNFVTSIPIDKIGKYAENQPESFRHFFIKEELSLLGIR